MLKMKFQTKSSHGGFFDNPFALMAGHAVVLVTGIVAAYYSLSWGTWGPLIVWGVLVSVLELVFWYDRVGRHISRTEKHDRGH